MTLRTALPAAVLLSALAVFITGGILFAGPLDPPVGPVASTAKPLSEVEPRTAVSAANTPGDADSVFRITLPGSYYLTGNVTGVAGKHGVEIAASGVTLDLNGFDLAGVAGMGAFDGVSATVFSLTNIAVVNGSVRNWGDEGVDLGSFFAVNCRVADVLASGNTGNGINGGSGCTFSNCSASQNTGSGISAGNGCTFSKCLAYLNSGNGFSILSGCTVADCTARQNTLDGIACSSACVIRGNNCSGNGSGGDGAGIHTTNIDNRIEGNNCTVADRGIDVDAAGNIIIRNTCSGNTSNWEIAIGNSLGPIVTAGTNAAPISGNGASASTLGSTDPNANFNY